MSENTSSKKVNPWIGVIVVLAVIIAVNVVATSAGIRFDLTEERQFTLSPGASKFLADMPVPVTLKFYYSRGNHVPGPLKQYLQRTVDLLKEMETAANGKLAIELFDPKPDSDEEEYAQRYGLIGQPINPMGGDSIYMGMVAVSGQRESAIPFLTPNAEAQLEYNITRLIHEVSRTTKPKIGVMSSLSVMGSPRMPGMRTPPDEGWMTIKELGRHFDVVRVEKDETTIASEITTLLLIHPKELSENTRYAIDQFVMRGGRLLVFADPLCLTERNASDMGGMMMMGGHSSDLNLLTAAWGATMKSGDVIGDLAAASQINFGNGQAERLPTWLSLNRNFINKDDVLLANIQSLMLPFAAGFELTAVEGVTATPLLSASSNAVAISSFMATAPGPEKMRSSQKVGALPLAVRLSGKFTSAFSNGPPVVAAGETNAPAPTAPHIAQAEQDGVVILVGDVDMINDQNAFRSMNIFGQTLLEYMNDNFNFMLSLVEQSAGSEALIGLRSRGVEDRSFTRVNELEQLAAERWQEEELKLTDRLQETQRRLNELQAARDDKQQVVLTPEQAAEIEQFRKERFETQRALKNVRRNLREDIEQLGFNVKSINMAAVPLLVAVYGLVRGWRRRQRS